VVFDFFFAKKIKNPLFFCFTKASFFAFHNSVYIISTTYSFLKSTNAIMTKKNFTTSLLLCAFSTLAQAQAVLGRPLIVPTLCDGQVTLFQTDNPTTALGTHTLDLPTLTCGNAKPNAVAVHGNDLIVTVNVGCGRMYKFTNYINDGAAAAIVLVNNSDNDYVGCAFNGAGELFAVSGNYGDNRLYKYASTSAAAARTDFGNAGMTSYLSNIAFDAAGNVWVTDYLNSRVIVFNPAGTEYRVFVAPFNAIVPANSNAALDATVNYVLSKPEGMAFDAAGNLWIGNNNDNGANTHGTLVKISPTIQNQLLAQAASSSLDISAIASPNVSVYNLPSPAMGSSDCFGIGAAARAQCGGLLIDKSNGKLYVSEQQGNTVLVFTLSTIHAIQNNHTLYAAATPTSQPGNNGIAFGVNSAVLATELLHFTAQKQAQGVHLNWQVASEKEAVQFDIERAVNGQNFVKIGHQKAVNKLREYTYLDENPVAGVSYYRLKINDLDEKFIYSKTLSVASNGKNTPLSISPNPAQNSINLMLEAAMAKVENMTLTDVLGQVVFRKKLNLEQGNTTQTVDLPVLAKGLYFVKIGEAVQRLIIQ
jgi:DNA-binding beta-propeller fold protein YncE